MNSFYIKFLDGSEPAWPDLQDLPAGKGVYVTSQDLPLELSVLPDGTSKGEPTVCFRINLLDGRIVLFETTARIFISAARMIQVKYEDIFKDMSKIDTPFEVIK